MSVTALKHAQAVRCSLQTCLLLPPLLPPLLVLLLTCR
jgi:hypothetical protein